MTAGVEDGRMFAAQGNLSEALAAAEAVLQRAPGDPGALLLKADVLADSREAEAALPCYRLAVEASPRSAAALAGLARCLHILGRNDEAIDVGEKARSLLTEGDNFRQTGPVYLTLVWCFRDLRRYREALAVAEEGLLRCPDAVLAQWASTVEEELADAEEERC